MNKTELTETEAKKSWVLRALGWKIRDIHSRFSVDPRRLYEVWEELEHRGSREKSIKLFKKLCPGEAIEGRFELHVPKLKVTFKPRPQQPELPF